MIDAVRPWTLQPEPFLPLQRCSRCDAFQHPPREVCAQCLGDALEWGSDSGAGTLLGISTLHTSFDTRLRQFLPLRIGSVGLDCGPVLIAYLDDGCDEIGRRVRVAAARDGLQRHVFVAVPASVEPTVMGPE